MEQKSLSLSDLFFNEEVRIDEEAKEVISRRTSSRSVNCIPYMKLNSLETLTAEEIKAAMKAVQKSTGQKGKNLFMPIRVAITGQTHGPDLPENH